MTCVYTQTGDASKSKDKCIKETEINKFEKTILYGTQPEDIE